MCPQDLLDAILSLAPKGLGLKDLIDTLPILSKVRLLYISGLCECCGPALTTSQCVLTRAMWFVLLYSVDECLLSSTDRGRVCRVFLWVCFASQFVGSASVYGGMKCSLLKILGIHAFNPSNPAQNEAGAEIFKVSDFLLTLPSFVT